MPTPPFCSNDSVRAMPNHLLNETSPYLKQHAHNPVDWYPWGEEALVKSKKEDKPIFLSIGYSACHWCHVMERESFEDEETAKILNAHFISIKVDREERPDLDHIYMAAVQLMTQHGGWPMTVFLTPDLQPFYGGTYFPPEDRMGMPSFKRILSGVAGAWQQKRDEVTKSAQDLTEAIREMAGPTSSRKSPLDKTIQSTAIDSMLQAFDPQFGGFGGAPKFFHTMALRVALREGKRSQNARALSMVDNTLNAIAKGGIYDHLGGGFHRYSTDRFWLVPHFEKMLYDNALITQLYLERIQMEPNAFFSRVTRETLDFILREMRSPEGLFFSTQDADSEGEEGKYYVWQESEIRTLLPQELADLVCKVYNVSERGNWEHNNILHLKEDWETLAKENGLDIPSLEDQLATAKRKLLAFRQKRIKPQIDEKILVSWNAMMIESLAMAYGVFGDSSYLESAKTAAEKILQDFWNRKTGLLYHSAMGSSIRFNAYLDDYALMVQACITLYEMTFDWKWVENAKNLSEIIVKEFWDEATSSFYFTPQSHEALVVRPKDDQDGATPSATAMAVTALSKIGRLLGKREWISIATHCLESQISLLERAPMGGGQFLIALNHLWEDADEAVLVKGSSEEEFETAAQLLRAQFRPGRLLASVDSRNESLSPYHNKTSSNGMTTLYVCHQGTCHAPLIGIKAIESSLS